MTKEWFCKIRASATTVLPPVANKNYTENNHNPELHYLSKATFSTSCIYYSRTYLDCKLPNPAAP